MTNYIFIFLNTMDTNTLAPEITDGVDLYQLLQISYDASEAEIRRAYRKTSIKYHPDKTQELTLLKSFNYYCWLLKL